MSRRQSSPHTGTNSNSTISGLNASSSSSTALAAQASHQPPTQPDNTNAANGSRIPSSSTAAIVNAVAGESSTLHTRHHSSKRPIALNGIGSTVENKNIDYLCPICFDLIIEAHITRCGHTFCFRCISKSVEIFKRCPKCSFTLTTCEQIFPNYVLDELITKYKIKKEIPDKIIGAPSSSRGPLDVSDAVAATGDGLKNFLTTESQKLTLPDVNIILDILQQRKQLLEAESCTAQNRLLYDFLKQLLLQKEKKKTQIENEIDLVQKDLTEVETILKNVSLKSNAGSGAIEANAVSNDITMTTPDKCDIDGIQGSNSTKKEPVRMESSEAILCIDDAFNTLRPAPISQTYVSRKRRMYAHFDDFVTSYFSIRSQDLLLGGGKDDIKLGQDDKRASDQHDYNTKRRTTGLDLFRENLVQFSKYNTLRPLATMHYSSDLHNNSTIVSTIVFDKDNEFFAIGGVTRRIKVFDYLAVVRDTVDIHYPNVEMMSNSKISCITWNSYHKNIMASSDYEGAVNLWDVQTGLRTKCFHEHEKRCWSVDFNDIDSRLIASGSDDARVKLWSLNDEHSIATLEAKANVCCVKFNPKSSCHLAFGSADHDVHYYDLRNMTKPLCVFKGHKKAVSYVKFLNTNEIISASTDSQLKLWNVNQPPYCLRSFVGHVNEKNFVGLATDGDYIACGSEDNSLYIYYKGLSKQLFNFKIDSTNTSGNGVIGSTTRSASGSTGAIGSSSGGGGGISATTPSGSGMSGSVTSDADRFNDINEFVSAVCWRKQCNVVLAANSRGLIKVLELV